jgi:hypothetical protein
MRVDLNGKHAFLKLYHRRFCPQLRKNKVTPAWNKEREGAYFNFVKSADGTEFMSSLEKDRSNVDPETTAQEEAYLYNECDMQYNTERLAYSWPKPLQTQDRIPKLLATVSFITRCTIPSLQKYFTIHGILLEYIDGYNLADLKPTEIPITYWPGITEAALRTVVDAGKLGILNTDVKLHNFIVRKDYAVVQLDYALCRFKSSYPSEQEWKEAKESEDEEGAVGVIMRRKIKDNGGSYTYKPSGLWSS